MSVSTPAAIASEQTYGLGYGRGELERRAIETLRLWIVAYIADYEREYGFTPRSLPVPPTPESIHGGIDFETFSAELLPELIVVTQPVGPVERYGEGTYGQWFSLDVAAIVTYEGSQDQTRMLADAYGTAIQKLIPQQGGFGYLPDGVTTFATRTRLQSAYALYFPDGTVRDIIRAVLMTRTFVENLVDDRSGPQVPPLDPYATPGPEPEATKVEVALLRGTPDTIGETIADAVILDGTVYPPIVEFEEVVVNEPADPIPEPTDD